uniref:Uncharacterized protein n=1 Tax=Nelumbo nucifera TaxID=4432 RepID=A0A822YPE7_NELNU|nr:TPA_asm: hypothetical protein HUJ06_006694 [Nelumbo nucifera]
MDELGMFMLFRRTEKRGMFVL